MQRLQNDAAWKAASEEREAKHARSVAEGLKVRSTVNADLVEIGINRDFAFFSSEETPAEAFPILFKYFKLDNLPPQEMATLVRCFAQENANIYWDDFRKKFEDVRDRSDTDPLKQALVVVLQNMCYTQDQIADLYTMIENPMYGSVRLLMLQKVRKSGLKIFQELFERLVENDETMRPEILSWKSYWKRRNPELLEKWKLRQ